MPITLNYRENGPMFVKTEPIIIVHGLFGTSENWKTIAQELGHMFKVVTVDLRNHGGSPQTDEMTYQQMAEDLKLLLDTLSIEKASFIGHNMGGKTVMTFAKMFPNTIKNLFIVDIAPVTYSHRQDQAIEAMMKLDDSQLANIEDADKALEAAIPNPEVRQMILRNLKSEEGKYQWQLNLVAIQKSLDTISGFPTDLTTSEVNYPVMFVGGEDSEHFQRDHVKAGLACFPGAQAIAMPGTGDWFNYQKAEQFANLVADYISRA